MNICDVVNLNDRERSHPGSSSREYLCIERISADKFELSIRGYEVLGEVSDYWDEDLEETILPDKIDGLKVQRIEDDYVIGGSLVSHSDDNCTLIFTDSNSDSVVKWLRNVEWNSTKNHDAISKIVRIR